MPNEKFPRKGAPDGNARRVLEQARERLQAGAAFAELHRDRPLFEKTIRVPGKVPVLVRVDLTGLVRVVDPKTGETLAQAVLQGVLAKRLRRCPWEMEAAALSLRYDARFHGLVRGLLRDLTRDQ